MSATNLQGLEQREGTSSSASSTQAELLSNLLWLSELLRYRLSPEAPGDRETGRRSLSPALRAAMDTPTPESLSLLSEALEQSLRSLSTRPDSDAPSLPESAPQCGCLPTLAALFELDHEEALLALFAVAWAADARFAKAFGAAEGLSAPARPTSDLIGRLLGMAIAQRLKLASRLRPGGRLERYGILRLDWNEQTDDPVHQQPLVICERIRWYLIETGPYFPPALRLSVNQRKAGRSIDESYLAPSEREQLHHFVALPAWQRRDEAPLPLLLLEGPMSVGQHEAVAGAARGLGLDYLEVDLFGLIENEPIYLSVQLQREALIRRSALAFYLDADKPLQPRQTKRIKRLLDVELRDFPHLVTLAGPLATLASFADLERPLFRLELKLPDRLLQRRAIVGALEVEKRTLDPMAIEQLLDRYSLTQQTAEEVVRAASTLAGSHHPDTSSILPGELEDGAHLMFSRELGQLGQRQPARFLWDDLVLPHDVVTQLKTLAHMVENRHKVLEQWGLDRKLSYGRGIKALFAGPSGTGKTMSAEVIANELKLPLYRVDLSAVVSKWIGETEKHLDQVFRESSAAQAILVFDEADALFSKRGDIKDGTDRYANIEVGYLLQRLELHDGVVFLTTNFPGIVDSAFTRRLHFVIDFPQPDEPLRRRMWEKLLISPLPLADDIDIPMLAHRFEVSPASIKNAVIAAAYLASQEKGKVGMLQVARAMAWEYHKLGRGVAQTDFGPYYELLER